MKIRLHAIREEGLDLVGAEPGEILGLEDAPEVGPVADVEYELHAQIASNELIVRGSVSAEMELECSRCGVFFSTYCSDSAFLRAYRIEAGSDEVDITDDLREAIILKMPRFALCSEGCAGLCPVCGKNMNRDKCECVPAGRDDRWGALDKLDLD